ncbi:TIGR00730 family Rossman fold protein [Paralimibaculum aggregatum]|uniref:Cytokinin riboside 5'-monophosphate phosphoribohydrolase n=1 Tax=Paralimibaculum aggregatum TaxID=3036245 RepID=A0ABQ6LG16_9RHOB|nr:TIGR00730 family Rossman fold protein [Limibaculum sp. NKW23]GMG82261.1 TIGR00730 family Rossman fold protein [Limibaculum sp. NKW23]
MTRPIRSVCLYCGSRFGREPGYAEIARRFGRGVAEAGLRLVYGGGDVGLMGEAARAAVEAGAHVTGIIPKHIVDMEIATGPIANLVVTETMHERKKLMFMNSDAVVALPGGPGTLDELIEVLTWRQLGLHAKPVVIVNHEGYWDPLLAMLEHIEDQGFMGETFRGFYRVAASPEEAIALLTRAGAPA